MAEGKESVRRTEGRKEEGNETGVTGDKEQ